MKKLTPEEKNVILLKGTEPPFSGKFCHFNEEGAYSCKQCGALLYHSSNKFDSDCGWPSFDDEISGAIKRLPDADGCRTEFTPKNKLEKGVDQKLEKKEGQIETAIFAGGCFWGVEHLMKHLPGVISVMSGYTGGTMSNPTYQDVCNHRTGHIEAVQIIFDSTKVTYETLAKRFFEIHDPEQMNIQGPDIGEEYRSEIFYTTPKQKEIALKLIHILKDKGYQIVTNVTPATSFWKAEEYHQNYYEKTGKQPYCHQYIEKF